MRQIVIFYHSLRYFFICGISAMWKKQKLCIKSAWVAAKIMAQVDYKRNKRKSGIPKETLNA